MDLQVFNYDATQVRTVVEGDSVLFVSKDVCEILEMDPSQVRRLDEDEKGLRKIQTLGGEQELTVITEGGLYTLIIRSNKPAAKPFRKWVTAEVLPAIRKTGAYSSAIPKSYAAALQLAADQAREIEEKRLLIEDLSPKAAFFDTVTESKDAVDIGTVAKVLNMGIGRTQLFKFLRERSILMGNNQPYQEYIDRGYFRVIESSYSKPDGSSHVSFKTVVYQKGIDFIRRRLEESRR